MGERRGAGIPSGSDVCALRWENERFSEPRAPLGTTENERFTRVIRG